MSCGNHHDTDCREVLEKVYLYLDNEAGDHDCAAIKPHLDECGPCLRQYGLEQHVNAMVARTLWRRGRARLAQGPGAGPHPAGPGRDHRDGDHRVAAPRQTHERRR